MSQSKKASMIEVLCNVGIGYLIAVYTQTLLFPMFGMHIELGDNLLLAGIFTVISIIRSYIFRRIANWITNRNNKLKQFREYKNV